MSTDMTKTESTGELDRPERTRGGRTYVPNCDIVEKENEIMVLADVPGVKSGDVDVTYEQGVLEISAKIQPRQDEDTTQYLLREYAVGDYHRSFRLGESIDVANIQAELKDGVLTLHLPKAEVAKRKQIDVKS